MRGKSIVKFTRSDLLALILILAIALAFTWPIFTSNYIIPQGGGDLVSFLWPNYRYAAQHLNLQSLIFNPQPHSALLRGQASLIPNLQSLLWNSTLYSGTPFLADNQNGFFYPPNLIAFLIFPDLPYRAMELLVAFHLFFVKQPVGTQPERPTADRPLRTPSPELTVIFRRGDGATELSGPADDGSCQGMAAVHFERRSPIEQLFRPMPV